MDSLYPALIVNWLTSPGGTRHRITKFIVEDAIMETLLPNVNTSEGCFNIGIQLSNKDFTDDAINMRKYEPYLLNDNSILSRIALLQLGIFGEQR